MNDMTDRVISIGCPSAKPAPFRLQVSSRRLTIKLFIRQDLKPPWEGELVGFGFRLVWWGAPELRIWSDAPEIRRRMERER